MVTMNKQITIQIPERQYSYERREQAKAKMIKLGEIASTAFDKGDPMSVLLVVNSQDYVEYMLANLDLFSTQAWWPEMLVQAWVGTNERLGGTLQRQKWLDLFLTCEREALHKAGGVPPDVDNIYRGTQKGDTGGYSWTSDKDTAVWFAERHSDPLLLTRQYVKNDLLFYSNDRNESEFVIIP